MNNKDNTIWKKYQRKGLSEMRPYIPGEDLTGVSVAQVDLPPKEGDMIARNPANHEDQWLVARKYFEENLTEAEDSDIFPDERGRFFYKNGIMMPIAEMGHKAMKAYYAWKRFVHNLENSSRNYSTLELAASEGYRQEATEMFAFLEQAVKEYASSYLEENQPAPSPAKTLDNENVEGARKKVSDIKVFGNGDPFKLLCKASSEQEGWMKSTKVCPIEGVGCIVQVTTQQKNPDGSYSIAEALTFVPGAIFVPANGDQPAAVGVRVK